MARSAKQPKVVKRRRSVLKGGAAALGGLVTRNPVVVGGSTAFLVTLFYVSANALWYQPFHHAGAFFATRGLPETQALNLPQVNEPETTINIERPASAPAPIKGDPVVEQVQAILKDLEFYPGTVDGISGPNTHKAIQAYQRKVGLSESGEIDTLLLDQLGATPATAAVPKPTPRSDTTGAVPTARPANMPAPAVAPDARIIKIQAGPKAFGNNGIELDGVVGSRTKAALKEFQSLFGLPQTGEMHIS